MREVPHTAMVLAAGLGRRMLPLTHDKPKPLIEVSGRPLIDWVLSPLISAGVSRFVVNVHYLASQLVDYLSKRVDIEVIISDESNGLLDTGGSLAKARPHLGDSPIFVANTDAFWFPADDVPLQELVSFFDDDEMDVALLLADRYRSLGYRGEGDFEIDAEGSIVSKSETSSKPYVYSGYRIEHPRLYDSETVRKFSVLDKWHRLIENNRIYGKPMDRPWLHVGDPLALHDAQVWLSFYGR